MMPWPRLPGVLAVLWLSLAATSEAADISGYIRDASNGESLPFVNVYLNDEDIRYTGGADTAVKAGDVLDILPALAGGA